MITAWRCLIPQLSEAHVPSLTHSLDDLKCVIAGQLATAAGVATAPMLQGAQLPCHCLTGHALFIVWLLRNLRERSLMSCNKHQQRKPITKDQWYHVPVSGQCYHVSGQCYLCQLLSRPSVYCQELRGHVNAFSSRRRHDSPVKRRWHAIGGSRLGLHCLGLLQCMGCYGVSSS